MTQSGEIKSRLKSVTRREFLIGAGSALTAVALTACITKNSVSVSTSQVHTSSNQTTGTFNSNVQTPRYGGTFKMIITPVSANIGWPSDAQGSLFTQVCFDTLLRGDNKGNIIPWLAESYKVADDLKSITFTLRKGVKFHDGSDFTAEVAKWNLDNYINAKSAGGVYWASVDTIDNYTIRVNLSEWKNIIPLSFGDASNPVFMVSKAAFDKNGLDWMRAHPIGTGPFKFDSFKLDASLKFVRNPDYWMKGKPYLDGVELIIIADNTTQKMVIETGGADLLQLTSGKDANEFTAMGFKVDTYPSAGVRVLIPDSGNVGSPWANQKVREAMEYAIDRESIAKALGYGWLQASYQLPPNGALAYDSNFPLARRYDPERAKQLLAETDYANGFKTTIRSDPFQTRDVAVAIQDCIAKVGIEADLEFTEIGRWISYTGFSGDAPENTVLFTWVPYGGDVTFVNSLDWMMNMEGKGWLKPPELTRAYEAALASPTIDTKLIKAVTDIITSNALFIPICENISGAVMQSYVIGFDPVKRGQSNYYNTEDVWLNK